MKHPTKKARATSTGTTTGRLAGSVGNRNYAPPTLRQPGGKPGPQTMPMGHKNSNSAIRKANRR